MTEQRVLDRLLDDLPVGEAPVEELLTRGRAARRRRRRARLTCAAGVAAVVLGGSALAHGGLDRPREPVGDAPPLADPDTRDLRVRVELDVPSDLAGRVAREGDVAVWDPVTWVLLVVPEMDYSSSCPPSAAARTSADGRVTLTLRDDPTGGLCQLDARHVAVTVTGVTEKPAELTLVQPDGSHTTVTVGVLGGDDRPEALDNLHLPYNPDSPACSELESVRPQAPATPIRPVPDADAEHAAWNRRGTVAAWFNQAGQLPELVVHDLRNDRELAREDLGISDVAEEPSLRILGEALYYRSAADPDVWMRYAWADDAYPLVYLACNPDT